MPQPVSLTPDDGAMGLGRMSILMLRAAVKDLDSGNPRDKQSTLAWLTAKDDGFISVDSACNHAAVMCERFSLTAQESLRSLPYFDGNDVSSPKAWQSLVDHALYDESSGTRDWVKAQLIPALSKAREADVNALLEKSGPASNRDDATPSSSPVSKNDGISM